MPQPAKAGSGLSENRQGAPAIKFFIFFYAAGPCGVLEKGVKL